MPAMSPTMTEGGISNWKVKEGDSFSIGEVLLEIETDKATIDVEAQDDGVMAKIIAGNGTKNVPVGKMIAILAEEGDDLSNIEIPKEEQSTAEASTSKNTPDKQQKTKTPSPDSTKNKQEPTPAHQQKIKLDSSKPLFPSVIRLLHENGLSPDKIKGTGRRGMLTKGDVLAHIGKASSPTGTLKDISASPIPKKIDAQQAKPTGPLDASELRQLIVEGLAGLSRKKAHAVTPPVTFDSIIAGYSTSSSTGQSISKQLSSTPTPNTPRLPPTSSGYLDGLI